MSAKYDAFGTQLQLQPVGGGAYVPIGGLRTIEGPGATVEERDATSHDSPGQAKEKRAGFIDGGDMSATMLYDPQDPTHQDFIAALVSRAVRSWKIVDVDDDASETLFQGFVKDFRPSRPYNDMLSASIVIAVTGLPTFPAAAT